MQISSSEVFLRVKKDIKILSVSTKESQVLFFFSIEEEGAKA